MRLLHIACQPVSPNPLQGRAGFAIISITGVSHAYTGPIRSGNPVQWRIPCGVVFRLTFRRRSFSTITTLQTSYHFRFFRIKGCLSSGIAFKASCQQQGSAKKTNNGQFDLCWRFQSTSPQHYILRRANLYPICAACACLFCFALQVYLSLWQNFSAEIAQTIISEK